MIGDVLWTPSPDFRDTPEARVARQRILCGESAERVASRDSLGDPDAIDAFVALAGEWTGALRTRTNEKTRPLRPREGRT
jgi:hypothetical protein